MEVDLMTLSEMAADVTTRVGQLDTNSVFLCKGFIRRRYQMVADAHDWRDLQMTATVNVLGGENSVDMPGSMHRVIAIRAGGRSLDPVDSTFLIQTDPTIFERTGPPTVYEEWTDPADSDQKKIKVFPEPTVHTPLFIVGRRVLPELEDADEPILRGIENCLVAYATGDMWERMRQIGKARAKFEEAAAMLTAAKAVETALSNKPRRSKGLTVAGNSLTELADAVCARTGMWSLDDYILAKDLLRRNYQTIYDSNLWKEATVVAAVRSDGEQLVLPHYFSRVIAVRADPSLGQLVPYDHALLFDIAPAVFEETTGAQVGFSILNAVGVKVLPPGLEALRFVSNSDDDKGKVQIRGESEGDEFTEIVTMDGLTPVDTANDYDIPLTIAKASPTVGAITVTGAVSTVEFLVLPANEIERKHIRLWLHPANTTEQTCLVLGKRHIKPFVSDDDTPMLRDIQGALIDMTVADMLLKAGNVAGATEARTKSEKALKALVDLENKQGASAPRIVPAVEYPAYDYALNDSWIVSK